VRGGLVLGLVRDLDEVSGDDLWVWLWLIDSLASSKLSYKESEVSDWLRKMQRGAGNKGTLTLSPPSLSGFGEPRPSACSLFPSAIMSVVDT
jgi:hypothetical protein